MIRTVYPNGVSETDIPALDQETQDALARRNQAQINQLGTDSAIDCAARQYNNLVGCMHDTRAYIQDGKIIIRYSTVLSSNKDLFYASLESEGGRRFKLFMDRAFECWQIKDYGDMFVIDVCNV